MSFREFTNTLKISFLHFKIICEHKSWVSYYCNIAGLSKWQAFKHDLSKFSYTEFSESVKYYSGDKSPIENAKEIKGYSLAWQHHKGRNPHHYEYWMDNFDIGTTPIRMPYKYAVEMICVFPAFLPSSAADMIAWLSASLPPDVKSISLGSAPITFATSALASSKVSLAFCPKV